MRRILLGLLALVAFAGAASAETLMMPKRDARKGTAVIVWGITTLPNSTPYSIDFGDGTQTNGGVMDRSYIAFQHTYATAGNFTATLTVGGEVATVDLQVFDPATMTPENQRSLGINMAIQDGLRWLWVNQNSRANFTSSQVSFGGGFTAAYTSLVTLAFENHGYKVPNGPAAPTGLYEKYIVRRGLNFVLANLQQIGLGATTHNRPDPDNGSAPTNFVDDPCVGVPNDGSRCIGYQSPADSAYSTAVAMLAFAGSGAMNRVNTEVNNFAINKTYKEILQRMANAQAWGQNDFGTARGGWWYNLNQQGQGDGSTLGWAILGLLDAEAAGAVVPQWVKDELKYQVGGQIGTVNIVGAAVNANGGLDYGADGNPNFNNSPGIEKGGIPLQGFFMTGDTNTAPGSRAATTIKYLSDRWNGHPGETWGCNWNYGPGADFVRGCSYAMFNAFKGLKLMGVTTLDGSTRAAGPGAIPAKDWYAEFQDHLVLRQQNPNTLGGGWFPARFSCCESNSTIIQAIAELVLSPVALVLPDEDKFSTVGLSPAAHSAIEGGAHTVTAHAESSGGTPVPGATVVFTILSGPNAGLTGTDITDANGEATFTYTDAGPDGTHGQDLIRATIGTLVSNTVEMNWTPKNRPPVAGDDLFTVPEDGTLNATVTGNDADPDNDALTITLLTPPTQGMLVLNANGTFTYQPAPNYHGPDAFTYKVNDGKVDGNVATVSITVDPVNDPPTAADGTNDTDEDTPVSGTVFGADIDGDALTFGGTAATANGSVVVNADGTYTYTPNANFHGVDSFTFVVSDGHGGTASGTVTITVRPVNDPPTANDGSNTTPEDTPVSGTVTGADVDGDALTFALVDGAAHGLVVVNAEGSYTYTPAPNYNGGDTFTFSVKDGQGGSAIGTVTLTVTPVNDGPVASNLAVTTPEDTPTSDIVAGADLDGDAITFALATGTTHGSVTVLPDGTFSYMPAPNYNGPDAFTFTVTDVHGATATGTVSITVTPVNDGPAANDGSNTTPEDTPVSGSVTGSDLDGDGLTFALATSVTNGAVTVNADGSYTYTPALNYEGADSFTFTVSDGHGGAATGTVSLTVTPVNDPPTADNGSNTTPEDTPVNGTVIGADLDGDALTFATGSAPAHGSVVVNADGSYTYTPAANYHGADSFTFTVSDGQGGTATGTVTLTVTPVNDPPVAADDAFATDEDTALNGTVLPNDTDVDGDMLTVALVSAPAHGMLALNPNGTFTYLPVLNYNGPDSFTYRVNDGTVDGNVATVSLTVRPVNDAPQCVAAPSVTQIWPPNHQLVPVTVSGSTDVDGDALTISVTQIFQDEPTNTQGDGNTTVDAGGIGTSTALVRAERAGTPRVPGNGRMYHIFYATTDGNGGSCEGVVNVGVPHDQGQRRTVIDGGALYNSLTGARQNP